VEINPYVPPQADLTVAKEDDSSFYIVATRKFWFLLVLTFGIYRVYWFYRNWKHYKEQVDRDIWPVPRAIFSVFFAHSLNRFVDQRPKRRQLVFDWSPEWCATIYVLFTVVANIADRLAAKDIGSPLTDLVGFIALPIWGWAMWQTQRAINTMGDDVDGESNSTFTAANYVWMALGTALWVLVIAGFVMILRE
jgi:hypothetical protein